MFARKVIRVIDDGIDIVMRIIFILIALMGVYIVVDSAQVYYSAGKNSIAMFRPEQITEETLKEISEDAVAWLTIDGTTIDYPVMQGESNSEYLNKDAYGDYSLTGSIFMDTDNSSDFSDDYTIVYGHHMAGGYMFGALDEFADENYFNEHLTGTLSTKDHEYDFQVYAFFICEAGDNEVFSLVPNITMEQRREFFKKMALNINEKADGRIIALTTCKDPGMTNRTILIGKISERKSTTHHLSTDSPAL